jgi:Raf kinase inhibitor-like YbhB/YbcL family protein
LKKEYSDMTKSYVRAAMVLLAASVSLHMGHARAELPFELLSPAFIDGGPMAIKNGGDTSGNPDCLGQNISPPINWRNAPAEAKSLVLMIFDPEGRPPHGVSHFVGYGIAPSTVGFAEGELSRESAKFVGGQNTMKSRTYSGPCTPPGAPHHYVFTLFATDLEPGALPSGLTRDETIKAIDGHTLRAAGLVGTFAHPR